MKPYSTKYILSFFLALALFLQAPGSFGIEQHQQEPIKLKVLALPFISYSPFFIANDEGYFADQRLKIEFIRMSTSEAAIPALASGDLDILGQELRTSSLNAIARNMKIRFVADKGHIPSDSCLYYIFIARSTLVKTGELKTPAQLKGRRISLASGLGTSHGYFMEKMLNSAGLKFSDVEIVEVPAAVQSEAMQKGLIDIAVGGEPWATRFLESGHGVLWRTVQEFIPHSTYDVVSYGPTLLQKNPEAGKRFMVAYLKAVRQYNQGKTERNLEIITKNTGFDRELLKRACWPPIRSDGKIEIKSVLDFQDWSIKKGLLDKPVTENQFWDPSFIEYANQVLGPATK